MFTKTRLSTTHGQRFAVETVRCVWDFHRALGWMLERPKEPDRVQMRVMTQILQAIDGPGRDIGVLQ